MKFINTDGLVFIGTGSEWFWTALSGMILVVTFLAIYRQLRMQGHATAIEQLESWNRKGDSERFKRYTLDILVALRDGTDPADLPEGAAQHIERFWEEFATLVRTGHRNPKLLWQHDSYAAQVWWAILAPRVLRGRAESGNASYMEDLEWLAGVMAEMDRRAGTPAFTSAWMARGMDRAITSAQEQIRVEQALRSVIVVSADSVAVEQSAAPAAPPAPAPAPAPQAAQG